MLLTTQQTLKTGRRSFCTMRMCL